MACQNGFCATFCFISIYTLVAGIEVGKKSKAVPLHAMEAHGVKEGKLLLILNFGTRWG
jgi:hypothetical protein